MLREPSERVVTRLNGMSDRALDIYDRNVDTITRPPLGVKDPSEYYSQLPPAKEIHDSFVERCPIFTTEEEALLSEPQFDFPISHLQQAREINSYDIEGTIPVPREVEIARSEGHWKRLVETLPKDSRISFLDGAAIVDFPIQKEGGALNIGTVVLDLRDCTESGGLKISHFLQKNMRGEVIKAPILTNENVHLRFKEQGLFFRLFKPGTTIASASRTEKNEHVINLHLLEYTAGIDENGEKYQNQVNMSIIGHELSHIRDGHNNKYSKKGFNYMLLAEWNGMGLPLSVVYGGTSTILFGLNPWILLFTGGQFALDRILHQMALDPDTEIGKAYANRWLSEMRARYEGKIIADLLVRNGFIADTSVSPDILDYYQPNTWIWMNKLKQTTVSPSPAPVPSLN